MMIVRTGMEKDFKIGVKKTLEIESDRILSECEISIMRDEMLKKYKEYKLEGGMPKEDMITHVGDFMLISTQ